MLCSGIRRDDFSHPHLPSYSTESCCLSDVRFEASLIKSTLLVSLDLGPVLSFWECPCHCNSEASFFPRWENS